MLEVIDLRRAPGRLAEAVARPTVEVEGARAAVHDIVEAVRTRGDEAVLEYTERFDGVRLEPAGIRVDTDDLAAAWEAIGAELRDSLTAAADRIRDYHDVPQRPHAFARDGVTVIERDVPVARAGVYVPGGRASYPSTVLMTVIPAQVAGVAEIALCVPPGPDGRLPASTAAAAHLLGLSEVYRIGGAQAIAAMAFGTATIPAVDVVVGPGNIYVALAKMEVSAVVGVESLAGPSECVIIVDEAAPPDLVAIDLVTQAEHGPGGFTLLVTWSDAVSDAVLTATDTLVEASGRRSEILSTFRDGGRVVLCSGPEQAMEVANAAAPEHLQLMVADPNSLVPLVRNAGAVFCGYDTPVTLGDYVAGPSHVLPTGGTARFASALRPADFVKSVHFVSASPQGLAAIGPDAAIIADAEGLEAHALAVRRRLGTA